MKGDARDKLHNLYTVIAGWVTVAGVLLVFAAVFSQWRVGLEKSKLVWHALSEAIMDREGDLPVSYTICNAGTTSCRVTARFTDMQDCQVHLKRSSMPCDAASEPGTMSCREPADKPTTVASCEQ